MTGNTSADNINVEVISRETMRIKIPADAKCSKIKDANGSDTYVEVYVATPNGISNSLLIPYHKSEKKKQGGVTGQAATTTFKASGAIEATITRPVPRPSAGERENLRAESAASCPSRSVSESSAR